jgi:iron(III) transport system substrate-binding protein
LVFPNQSDRGAHANISGMSLGAYAPHKEAALDLMRFLTSEKAQEIYASANGEYPLRKGVPSSPSLQALGEFKIDPLALDAVSQQRGAAVLMTDEVRYDH